MPILGIIWITKKLIQKESFPNLKNSLAFPFIIFISIASISLLNGIRYLENVNQLLSSSLYLIRFISYFFLYLITIDLGKKPKQKKIFINVIIFSSLFIALAGFIQLVIYSDFSEIAEKYGFDPHQDRLLSTWFDPNFVGGFFSLMITVIAGIFLYTKSFKKNFSLASAAIILIIALFYTYSRSAYLSFAISIFLLGLIKSRQLIIIILTASILIIPLSERAQERLLGFQNSAKALFGIGTEIADPTAELRLESWRNSIDTVKKYPLLGTGFNTLRYLQHQQGIIADPKIHSASGSDSSLLTILMTTGIFGLLSYLWLYGSILKRALIKWRNIKIPSAERGLALGFLCGMIGLFAHSFFVNSLLFSPMLVYFWILAGLNKQIHKSI